MNWLKQNWIIICIGGVVAAPVFIYTHSSSQIYLYAWERPEDFSFLKDQSGVGIVFYAGDIVIKDNKIDTILRRNSLKIPDGLKSIPLIRIDSFDSPDVLNKNKDNITKFIIQICGSFRECQIDFEARTSEYDFYINLMDGVHTALPNTKISATALASWCSSPSFIDNLSANIVVPMLYRMGKDSSRIKGGDVGSWFLSNSKCSDNIALSTDELDFNHKRYSEGKSIYLFSPESWTRESFQKALEEI
jgi:hypothetical protein